MTGVVILIIVIALVVGALAVLIAIYLKKQRKYKNYERGLKMIPMLIHLPPETEDIDVGSRDERDVIDEQLSNAQVMYSILSSTITKGFKSKIFGQRHLSFEIIAHNGLIKYYTVVPAVLTETVKQAVVSAYPTARLEEVEPENIFSEISKVNGVAGGELELKKDFIHPINTYEDKQNARRDATQAILNAMSTTKKDEGLALQLLIRPIDGGWVKKSKDAVQKIREGKD
ncbi:MAG: ATP-binding protein, partial [Bacteroidaceae bacterium]|nr:ATP-binding protein [Bacteroidaceae bacterium]